MFGFKLEFRKNILIAVFFVSFFGIQNANAAITSQLDLGSSGTNVVELQTYFAINITGYFDSFTQSATQKFQTEQGIVSSGNPETTGYGRVGPRTMLRINSLLEKEYIIPSTDETYSGLPMRLKIPEINVETNFEYMGLTLDGTMDMTKSLNNVVWFNLGPRPGENGSAVIAGHYAGIFNNLHKLSKGDKLFVEDEKGAITAFVVREFQTYNPDADASKVFTLNDGKAHLNLITCEGTWNEISKTYSKRLVMFADKE
ncbi:MAG: sortase [bacterium]|nr:sortase [bacterium]